MGPYWLLAVALAGVEIVLAAALMGIYWPAFKRRGKIYKMLGLLSLALLVHGSLSLYTSLALAMKGYGPDMAMTLIPTQAAGALIAGILFAIANR